MTIQLAMPGAKNGRNRVAHTEANEAVKAMLAATGLPWQLEKGSKHIIVRLNGTKIGVLCVGRAHRRDERQIASAIRKFMQARDP